MRWSTGSLVTLALGACSNIIGISDYEIDPALDPDASQGGTAEAGGGPAGSEQGGTDQGGAAGQGGTDRGGAAGQGGTDQGGTDQGGTDQGGTDQGGAAGQGWGGAACAERCDDEIECTIDRCGSDGDCVHTPDSSLCDEDPDECVTCQEGLGCVAQPAVELELLLDPAFDEVTGDWQETVLDHPDQTFILTLDEFAHTPTNSAWWVPLTDPAAAEGRGYADLAQYIVIPEGAKQLRLSGYYQLLSGSFDPADEYVSAALFRVGATTALATFHDWSGASGYQDLWQRFEYVMAQSQFAAAIGDDLSFDLYGEVWDSAFYFDTLSLTASVCE